jgi:hypothetical protein
MPHWTKIMLHDSRDKHGRTHSYREIRSFHQSFKDLKAGEVLTETEALGRIDDGETGISRPWKEAGFHYAVERVQGTPEIIMLRPATQNGAHSREGNMNRSALSILIHGDLGEERLADDMTQRLVVLVKYLMKTYKIPVEGIITHRARGSTRRACPGDLFNVEEFREAVRASLLVPSP